MPTAARLIAAFAFAALAWFASELIKPLFPEGTQTGWFSEVNGLIGIAMGWKVMGSRVGDGYRAAMGYGVTTSFVVVLWALVIHSTYEMLILSLRKAYNGPMEAVVAIFQLMLDFGRTIMVPDVMITLVVGGMLCGLFAEWTNRRWT